VASGGYPGWLAHHGKDSVLDLFVTHELESCREDCLNQFEIHSGIPSHKTVLLEDCVQDLKSVSECGALFVFHCSLSGLSDLDRISENGCQSLCNCTNEKNLPRAQMALPRSDYGLYFVVHNKVNDGIGNQHQRRSSSTPQSLHTLFISDTLQGGPHSLVGLSSTFLLLVTLQLQASICNPQWASYKYVYHTSKGSYEQILRNGDILLTC